MTVARRARTLGGVFRIVVLAILLRGSTALADDVASPPAPPVDHPRVALDVSGCPADFAVAARRIVGVEIGDLLAEPERPLASSDDRLSIACDGGIVRIAAEDAAANGRIERTLSLADFPADAAPRAVALAGIEALATLSPAVRQRIGTQAHPVTSQAPISAAAVSVIAAKEPPFGDIPRTVTLSGVWRWFPASAGIALWGGRIAVDRSLGAHFNLSLDLDALAGDRQIPAGEVGGVLISAGASAGIRNQWSRIVGDLAVGARGGVARLVGHPADAASVAGARAVLPWAGPMISGRILAGRGRLVVGATLEAGVAVLSAKGTTNGDTVLAISGVWLAASVGAGIRY